MARTRFRTGGVAAAGLVAALALAPTTAASNGFVEDALSAGWAALEPAGGPPPAGS